MIFLHFCWVGVIPPDAETWCQGISKSAQQVTPLYDVSPYAPILMPNLETANQWVMTCESEGRQHMVQAAKDYETKVSCREYVAKMEKRDKTSLLSSAVWLVQGGV